MLSLVARLLEWLRSLFWKEEMELTLVGLQYSGKTTLLTVLASGQFTEDMIPTVGFNMRKITKGNVTIKVMVNTITILCCSYMVDAADLEKVEASKNELHSLIDKPQLHGIPVLVLGNKRDLPGALDEKQLIEKLKIHWYSGGPPEEQTNALVSKEVSFALKNCIIFEKDELLSL
ncbi:hypothetical protein DUI87_13014 [Hirundo rustica rustica]|uniref:Uncharacterized protein n=1 Tax=Hirundo rustica rustica TaxID=333673 RepID=A0A3M0KAI1_HIRRU|nr:hypothetical protein DUI87_13014 [Hirundo rustica rustica]